MPANRSQHSRQIPSLTGVIDRPRLLAKLESVMQHKITLLCAPPGYGKTTIADHFADKAANPVIWHRIEERERDIPYFHDQCVSALSLIAPEITSIAYSPSSTPVELAAAVANHLRDTVQTPFVYVLDDVHNLS